MSFKRFISPYWILSIIVLFFFSFQYFFSSTVPIGGDAASHVYSAKEILNLKRFFSVPYPLTEFLFSFSQILPLSWEKRFIFWTCLGYLLAGITLGVNLKKISGTAAASFGVIFWAISTWNILPFYRDGTMPQLWSMIFLNFFIYFLIKKSKIGIIVALILLKYSHPATFAVAVLALLLSWPYFFRIKLILKNLIIIGETLGLILILMFFPNKFPYFDISAPGVFLSLESISKSIILPAVILSPIGLVLFLKTKQLGYTRYYLFAFSLLSFFLLFSHWLGTPNFERRFAPYGITMIIIFGSIGLNKILNSFTKKWIRITLSLLLLFPLAVNAGLTSREMYHEFEGGRKALHPEEKEAYIWMSKNIPADSLILQTNERGRGAEWLRVYSERENIFLTPPYVKMTLFSSCEEIIRNARLMHITHIFFYQWAEKIPNVFNDNANAFQIIYKNKFVTLFKLPDQNITNLNQLCSRN